MASVDHIALQIPAQRSLARVVRAAVSVAARGSGIPGGRATTFANSVARRFTELAQDDKGAGTMVSLVMEPAPEGLDVAIGAGGASRPRVLKVRSDTRRPSRAPRRSKPRRSRPRRV